MKAQTTAPEATLSQDPASRRVCSCLAPNRVTGEPQPATFEECVCDWGRLIRQALWLGYGATAMEATQYLAELGGNLNVLAARRRREILQGELDKWTGTTIDFCRSYNITRAQFDNFGLRRSAR